MLGRLFSGIVADRIGALYTYAVLISVTILLLLVLPWTSSYMTHDSSSSTGMYVCMYVCVEGGVLLLGAAATVNNHPVQ